MNKLLLLFVILAVLGGSASAAQISGNVTSGGEKLAGQTVTLSRINGTVQSEESMTGIIYNFVPLADTATDKDGNYVFSDLKDDEYRVNVTYNGSIFGEHVILRDKAVMDFNLSEKIEGSVMKANNTLEGIPLRLLDIKGIEVMNTFTNESGKYLFNNVNAGRTYIVEATYEDVPYTELVNASESVDFTVYDTTEERDIISVKIDHIVLSRVPTGIKVDEYVEFMNTGDKVFFSKDRTWLGISTPEGITRFQTDVMECCLVREKNAAWIDPMKPLLPGETYGAEISYILSPDSSEAVFTKEMIYNTSYFTLLSERNNGFGIESTYAKKQIVPSEGREFEVLTSQNIPRNQIVDTQITGYVPSRTEGDFNYLIPLVAVALVGAVSYPFLKNRMTQKTRRRSIKPSPSAQVPVNVPQEAPESKPQLNAAPEDASGKDIIEMSFDELLAEKNAAFESILNLENRFNDGEIPEKEYKELKKQYKEKAMLIIKQLKERALNLDLEQPVPVLEKIIERVDDIDILEELLDREKEGENRDELKSIIEQRIENIEQNE
ncbi:hypothetical protein ANME2D_00826 [Candidatus Methanoperedens nitroreducens]|uniref:Uncharacterized protein n=1 Tax=Candidatus Methanoperedens nitratireducens TaxID=1392998 RepID=A0A062V9G7_9EURY|nr:carboxypeptidase-like regulatory domain-containing protein [Candidatus Methanoperedens nitroreducens]KCZ72399.1 hypothetical protein ANME2D_00826 [Candidatus Methanoperedens nitroreducens]MDJ1423667.1 carboxypeptidase-like regulatory domain-containing protein [Candidatus Methanoperedens sp.]